MKQPILGVLTALLLATISTSYSAATPKVVVATIGDQSITLEEIDELGGRLVYDASTALYEARVKALYKLLSDQALAAEAKKRNVTVDVLTEKEVLSKVGTISDAEIDALIKAKNMDVADKTLRSRVASALTMERANNLRKDYLTKLFKEHGLKVTLPAPTAPPPEEVRGLNASAKGPDNAPVSIIVFSDFQCPYCRQMAGVLNQVSEQNPKDVRIVHRTFPVHSDSQKLSEAALCAEDQHKFWEYHDLLFRDTKVDASQVHKFAEELNLNTATFKECLDTGKHAARVIADGTEATRLGIKGTPTLFINGVRVSGMVSLARLTNEVRQAVERSTSRSAAVGASRP